MSKHGLAALVEAAERARCALISRHPTLREQALDALQAALAPGGREGGEGTENHSLQARAAAVWDPPPTFPGWDNKAAAVGWNIADLLYFADQHGINAYAEAEKLIAHRERQLALAEAAVADPAILDAAMELAMTAALDAEEAERASQPGAETGEEVEA